MANVQLHLICRYKWIVTQDGLNGCGKVGKFVCLHKTLCILLKEENIAWSIAKFNRLKICTKMKCKILTGDH